MAVQLVDLLAKWNVAMVDTGCDCLAGPLRGIEAQAGPIGRVYVVAGPFSPPPPKASGRVEATTLPVGGDRSAGGLAA